MRKEGTMKKSRRYLKKKCDRLWSSIIIKTNNGKCEICGKEGKQPHHFIGRKNLTLRHDLRNGINLCYTHHVGGKYSAHGDPIFITLWMMEHRPDDYNYLFEKREVLATKIDYQEVIEKLEKVLK